MTGISLQLATVLDRLPIAVSLFSRDGQVVGKAGGAASMFNGVIPALNAKEASRWTFLDRQGTSIPRTLWASARAYRGERNYAGLIGTYRNGEEHRIRVTCMPVCDPGSDVAVVAFLQVLNAQSRSAEGSHMDLQVRLIDQLVSAVSAAGPNGAQDLARRLAS
jgi:hypothetical protein